MLLLPCVFSVQVMKQKQATHPSATVNYYEIEQKSVGEASVFSLVQKNAIHAMASFKVDDKKKDAGNMAKYVGKEVWPTASGCAGLVWATKWVGAALMPARPMIALIMDVNILPGKAIKLQ